VRSPPWILAEPYRIQRPNYTSAFGDDYGLFEIPSPYAGRRPMRVIANAANEYSAGWEHVSVSLASRCPNWHEMEYVREIFWLSEETVMQLSVPRCDHINLHRNCLHLWRPTHVEIPRPPAGLVG
jgi:hypothetical protein